MANAHTIAPRQNDLQPVLTTLRNTPDLSTFYSLFASTGGDSGIPAPAFEERFNDNRDKRRWTILAPINSAFEGLSHGFIDILTAPPAYELLAAVLRSHVIQGNYSFVDLTYPGGRTLEAVEGFTVTFAEDGDIFTNDGLTESAKMRASQATLDLSGHGYVPASNGGIYRIDNVLAFFETYFGIDKKTDALPPKRTRSGTMADVLKENPNLSTLRKTLEEDEPELVERLSLFEEKEGDNRRTVYLAPSNAAFEVLPGGADEKATQQSNDEATSYLLSFGLGTYEDGSKVVQSDSGFNITVDGGMANNAKVQDRVCTDNGCVWIMGRWLDPFYGVFDH